MAEATNLLQRTPLHTRHLEHGARMVPFAGWEMPVQYRGILEEHRAVREQAGLFDVSHMGEVLVEGDTALEALQQLVPNDVARLAVGHGLYTPMCYPHGGIVDDLIIFCFRQKRYLMVVNAATHTKDLGWIEEHALGATVRDISREMALLALQGPAASTILRRLTTAPVDEMRPFDVLPEAMVAGRRAVLSRTGYTGEDGFELGPAWDDAPVLWDALLDAGASSGLVPVGLGARDTLRLEAGLMLYGNDIDDTTSPLEAPLGWTVKWEKGDFMGREALLRQREQGPPRKLVGFAVEGRAVARHGYGLLHQETPVGAVTSGTFSPTLQMSIGMGYLPFALAKEGALSVEIRERVVPIRLTRLPFYRSKK
ncbi:MAG TPA: glycine cleavage system aminomethyltransferase GcvT [bacterium]|nr:glycine cleavage system aminomethyltransferase GcvT [bacterium]